MRRYFFYIAITISAFVIGLLIVAVSYFKTDLNADAVEDPTGKHTKSINQTIDHMESENTGYEELSNARDGDSITVRGMIDEKFLCHDVTKWQSTICTTVLIGNSTQRKSLLIRLSTCDENRKSNCIVWKPDNLCAEDKLCSSTIRIYDHHSKPTDLIEEIQTSSGGKGFYHKNIELKITGKVSVVGNKPRLLTPIEKLEIVELRQN